MELFDDVIIVEPPTKQSIIRKKDCIFLSIIGDCGRQTIKIYIGANILKKIGFYPKSKAKAKFGYHKNDKKKWYLILTDSHGYTLSKSNTAKKDKASKNNDDKSDVKDILCYSMQLVTPFENIKSIRKKEILMDYVELIKDKERPFLTFSVNDLIKEDLVERVKE